jgi:hypothetical protein
MSDGRNRRVGECVRCNRTTRLHGRDLCMHCYGVEREAGNIEKYPIVRVSRMAQVRPLLAEGKTSREIATLLGCSIDAVITARKRIARADGAVDDLADEMRVPEPPDRVACIDATPGLFDITFTTGRTAVVRDGRLLIGAASQVEAAFRYCASCPLATREWCRDVAVRPRQSQANIITAGEVWISGRRVWTLSDHARRGAAA